MSEEYKRAFESKDEFMNYYNEHKEEIDKLTTKQLNSVYKIKDCKLSRNKKKLVVKVDIPKIEKPKEESEVKEDKPKSKPKSQNIKPENLEKMINHIITEYEKQLSSLKELKNKLVSKADKVSQANAHDLFESDKPNSNIQQEIEKKD